MAVQTQVASLQSFPIHPRYLRAKRVLDILFTVVILLPLCVVMVIVAVCIFLDSKGPIFYRQRRVGRHRVEFEMLKFRSMYVNSDDLAHRNAVARYLNGEKVSDGVPPHLAYKQVDDPRVTRVGRFIRRTSIDELPQFLNVLRGEMSLVGPRPPLPYEVERYAARDLLRLSGKPGLTGTWQIYGRSRVPFQRMVEMDIEYLQQQSLREDLKLIALTLPVIVMGQGGV